MISFYPGPSRVYDGVPRFVKQAFKEGVLSMNHRSPEFVKISQATAALLHKKLGVPEGFVVYYTGSATECWEIIAQSLRDGKSYHVFNGAFGEKWYAYTKKLGGSVKSFPFEREALINTKKLRFDETGVICITQNETSNGTQVEGNVIREIRDNNPNHLIAVDATSSMAGISLDFNDADIWFASVQKCFGLPAGLALMICSPRAVEKALAINETDHYNSLTFMHEMMQKWQTPYTPSVLNIYLLMRVLEDRDPIEKIHQKTVRRYEKWIAFLEEQQTFRHLIRNEQARSFTVLTLEGEESIIAQIKVEAKSRGYLLGEGYGELKPSTFRIANFPAIRKNEIEKLMHFLSKFRA